MAKWQVNNPIRYDVPPQQGGDTVYNGFLKSASEFNTIYNFLNTLRTHRASASPPTDAEVNELWLDTSVNPPTLKRWDGASWVDVKVGVTNFSSNSDKVDGFNTSQTPTANTIPVADSTGKISTGWLNASTTPTANTIPVLDVNGILNLPNTPAIKTNTYTFRRVDLTNATADYNLAVGEEAIINFNATSFDLHIAIPQTPPVMYEITLFIRSTSSANLDLAFLPNKTTYSSAFTSWNMTYGGTSSFSLSYFLFDCYNGTSDTAPYIIKLIARYWGNATAKHVIAYGGGGGTAFIGSSKWNDTSTAWTSLGIISNGGGLSMTGTAIVRRIA